MAVEEPELRGVQQALPAARFVELLLISATTAPLASWLSYLEREVVSGGCSLTAASIEFDDRPGPVRDAIATAWGRWLDVVEREVATAQTQGHIAASDVSPRQIAFQLHACVIAGNSAKQLFRDSEALEASRVAINRLLREGSSTPRPR